MHSKERRMPSRTMVFVIKLRKRIRIKLLITQIILECYIDEQWLLKSEMEPVTVNGRPGLVPIQNFLPASIPAPIEIFEFLHIFFDKLTLKVFFFGNQTFFAHVGDYFYQRTFSRIFYSIRGYRKIHVILHQLTSTSRSFLKTKSHSCLILYSVIDYLYFLSC